MDVAETLARYGRLKLVKHPAHGLILEADDPAILTEVTRSQKIQPLIAKPIDDLTVPVHPSARGQIKQELTKLGWPVEDLAGYVDGESHPIALNHDGWQLRDYQQYAAQSFWEGGSGVVVLPCGAGKTIVGAASMAQAQTTTLILVTNTVAGRQWRDELLRRTTLTSEEIGEYSGEKKEIHPVTIATYQVVTRKSKGEYRALELFDSRDWGLIICDEVHLLPAPVFRMAADFQSRRRLGLTATLVREDGREDDVFSLIWPKRYDAPERTRDGRLHRHAECVEVRTTLTDEERLTYATAEARERYRLAACSAGKLEVVDKPHATHKGQQTLIIGAYVDQLEEIASRIDAPLADGKTTTKKREEAFQTFRDGESSTLVVSKVANFSIVLPEAAVAIQISGTFGTRQEEAQRLRRLLRPKADGAEAVFYTVVASDTLDYGYAMHRQRFLAEQGYAYRLVDAADL